MNPYEAKKAMMSSFGLFINVRHLFLYAACVRICADVTDALRVVPSILAVSYYTPVFKVNPRRQIGNKLTEPKMLDILELISATSLLYQLVPHGYLGTLDRSTFLRMSTRHHVL
jgi:hypothetical protein